MLSLWASLAFIAPQLAEALFENIGRVEPLVGRQQRLQRLLAFQAQVLLARQQRVFLTLDVAPLAALEPAILALANRIQGFAQMADDMELIEQNRRLRRMRIRRQSKRLPHVHDLSLIHISEPTRLGMISYAVFCL